MSATRFITLPLLRQARQDAGLTPRNIVTITEAKRTRNPQVDVITMDRLKQLENLPRHEPTYAEARDLARLLLLPGIIPLVTPAGIFSIVPVIGPLRIDDIYNWRLSDTVPLSVACRIAVALGLDDPMELEHMPIHSQLWETLERNERGASVDECPWCLGAAGHHLPTCLPSVVWAPRDPNAIFSTATFPVPGRPSTRGDSRRAHGLKVCRIRKGVTAKQLAHDVGKHPNYISRLENLDRPLTQQLAERIAPLLGVTVEALYS